MESSVGIGHLSAKTVKRISSMAATARKNYRMPGLCTNGSDINNIIDMNNDSLKFREESPEKKKNK